MRAGGTDAGDIARLGRRHTWRLKTAISVPDHVYERAEHLARRAGRRRSELYSTAVAEYLARHEVDEVTAAIDRVIDALGQGEDPFISAASNRVLHDTEW